VYLVCCVFQLRFAKSDDASDCRDTAQVVSSHRATLCFVLVIGS